MKHLVEVQAVSKYYGDHKVVDAISFMIDEEEIFALLGPNGAGKSTLIAMLSGLSIIDKGKILIDGFDVSKQPEKIGNYIGVVFQNSRLDERLSGYQNLMVRSGFYHIHHQESKQRIRKLISICELETFINQPVCTLSGGQKRRLDIARSLLAMPRLLILDEPTTGLDPLSRKQIWACIIALQKEHKMSVLLTTHYMEEAHYAHRIAMMKLGKIVVQGSLQELTNIYVKDRLYLYSNHLQALQHRLDTLAIPYEQELMRLCIYINKSYQALSILQKIELYVDHFEVHTGSIEDVYLHIVEGNEL